MVVWDGWDGWGAGHLVYDKAVGLHVLKQRLRHHHVRRGEQHIAFPELTKGPVLVRFGLVVCVHTQARSKLGG